MLGRPLQKMWRSSTTSSLFSRSPLSPPSLLPPPSPSSCRGLSHSSWVPSSTSFFLPSSSSCMTQRLYSAKPRQEDSGAKKGEEFRAIQRKKALYARQQNPPKLEVPNVATPRGLASLMGVRTTDILKIMIKLGAEPRDSRDPIDDDLTDMIFEELYFIPERPKKKIDPFYLQHVEKRLPKEMHKDLVDRPPIISVMGHVDHGKTTLLDTLRGVSTATVEAGKITQILASFLIEKDGYKMTFLDTPGHAAFTTMREASCFASDLIILVVATDEGVQEQTVESIRIIQEYKKPFILVVTKVDKENPNMDLIAQQLVRHNVFTDMVGGEVTTLQVSAKNKTGLEDLIDAVVLETEGLHPQAIPKGFAEGVVLESMTTKHKGCGILVMTLWGSLKKGDAVAIGKVYGKIRAMEILEAGKQKPVNQVGPSCPVILYGIKEHPNPGDTLLGAKDERTARRLVEYRKEIEYDIRDRKELFEAAEERRREREQYFHDLFEEEAGRGRAHEEEEEEEEEEPGEELAEVNFVVKANMWGSVVALTDSLEKMLKPHKDELKYQIVKASTGTPSSSDIDIALTTMSHFVCYGVDFPDRERDHLLSKGLKIIQNKVIFGVLTQVSEYVATLLKPHLEQKVEGEAFVKQLFSVKKKRKTIPIIGCEVQMGKVSVGSLVKVLRNGEEIARGEISALRHFKDSVKSVKKGQDCGIFFTRHKKAVSEPSSDGEEESEEEDEEETQIMPNDVLLVYTVEEKPRKVGEPRRII